MWGGTIDPQRPMAADANTLILLPLLGDTVEKGKNEPTKFLQARRNRFSVIRCIAERLRRPLVGDGADYMSSYIIFGLPHRCL